MTTSQLEYMIKQFESNHRYTTDDQFKVLIEEIGELSEAMLQNEGKKIGKENKMDTENISEEIGDVIFTCITIARLYEIDWLNSLYITAKENKDK